MTCQRLAATAGGTCTLRAAIQEANALPGPHYILVPAGVFYLTLAGAGENNAATGDLDIRVDLSIQGSGMSDTTIDGLGADRVFDVQAPVGAVVKMADLTIRNGDAGGG